jgi:hypothetical protein
MSPDRITRVTSTSWFGRIGNAIKGVLFGFVLFAAAFPLLFWNEGRAIHTFKTLKEGQGLVVSVPADPVDAAKEGRLVHISGRATTEDMVSDAAFGVSATAIKLERGVEMYQWKEKRSSKTKKKLGGGEETVTTFDYSKAWSDDVIDSSKFEDAAGHRNPDGMAFRAHVVTAPRVMLGAFTLPESLVAKLHSFTDLPLPADYRCPPALGERMKRQGDGLYLGRDPDRPEIGDLRIRFGVVLPQDISVVSRQVGPTFEPYQAKAGGQVHLLQTGLVGAEQMFQHAQSMNKLWTWLIRLGGFLLMLLGLALILNPLSVLADVVPLFGTIVAAGTGFIAACVAGILSLTTVAIAWFAYRPLLSVALGAGVVVILVLLARRKKKTGAAS